MTKHGTPLSDKLYAGLGMLGIEESKIAAHTEKLHVYISELELFNSVCDLTAAKTREDIAVRHILDSLAARNELLRLKEAVLHSRHETGTNGAEQTHRGTGKASCKSGPFIIADIGTGGGLPGIPLAITMPDTEFVLVERMSKRCLFLENCAAILGLKNVQVQNIEAERIERSSFDIAVFRAFRPLDKKTLKMLLRTLKDGGGIAAYKGKKEVVEKEMAAAAPFINGYTAVPLYVPFLEHHERHLVIIQP